MKPHPRRGTWRRALLELALVCGGAACASNHAASTDAKGGGGNPIRIQYVHYTSGQRLELIDQSRSSSAELYSKTRKLEDVSTKVTTDEVLQETVDYFDSKGFFDRAESGGSPASGQGLFLYSLEVETPKRFVHLSVPRTATPADVKLFTECKNAFIAIFNNTYQLQSVDRAPDWDAQNTPGQKPGKKKIQ